MQISPIAEKHLREGSKIRAIKALREEQNGMGLKEAKEAIEAHIAQNADRYPELQRSVVSGNTVLVILGIVGTIIWLIASRA